MAYPADNGDVASVVELGHFDIPGAGHNRDGSARNNKTIRWGRITGLYVSTGLELDRFGELGRPFGLDVLDHVSLEVRTAGTVATPTYPTASKGFLATLKVDGKIFIVIEVGDTDPTIPSAGDTIVLNYLAVGESYHTPELV